MINEFDIVEQRPKIFNLIFIKCLLIVQLLFLANNINLPPYLLYLNFTGPTQL